MALRLNKQFSVPFVDVFNQAHSMRETMYESVREATDQAKSIPKLTNLEQYLAEMPIKCIPAGEFKRTIEEKLKVLKKEEKEKAQKAEEQRQKARNKEIERDIRNNGNAQMYER